MIGRVYSVADMFADPAFRARRNLVDVDDGELGAVTMHGVVPALTGRQAEVRWTGPGLGEHTDEVLVELGGVQPEELEALRSAGVVG